MINWLFQTLKSYPEIAIFLSLAFGYYFGSFTYKGLGLGAVTATLIFYRWPELRDLPGPQLRSGREPAGICQTIRSVG